MRILLAAGAIAFVAGAAILTASLARMWGIGPETATTATPPLISAGSVVNSATGLAGPGLLGPASKLAGTPVIIDAPINGIAFQMSVPALGYTATVREGIDIKVLDRGPGHYPTSAWPGRPGNVGIAAHNVYWLGFARLTAGDRVEIKTRRGLYVYEITGSKVTSPNDMSVFAPTLDSRLTLTTCYPLWAGAFATKRLVFTARQIGGVA